MSSSTCHYKEKKGKKICPICDGKKTVPGVCTCDMEWRGTKVGEAMEDCQCTPDMTCTKCNGTGYIEE